MTLLFGIIIGAFVGITMVALVTGNKYEDAYRQGYNEGFNEFCRGQAEARLKRRIRKEYELDE